MDIAERRRIVSSDRQQRQFRRQSLTNLAESGEVGGVAGVVERVPIVPQDVATITAMRISDYPGGPMARRHMGDGQLTMAITIPPVQFDYVVESQVGNQIEDVVRDDDSGRRSAAISSVLDNRAQRWPVQMVEVGVG